MTAHVEPRCGVGSLPEVITVGPAEPVDNKESSHANKHARKLVGVAGAAVLGVLAIMGPGAGPAAADEDNLVLAAKQGSGAPTTPAADGASVTTEQIPLPPSDNQRWSTQVYDAPVPVVKNGDKCLTSNQDGSVQFQTCYDVEEWWDGDEDTGNPCSACAEVRKSRAMSTGLGDLGAALEHGGRRARMVDKRLLALIFGQQDIHGPTSLPKRQATPATPQPVRSSRGAATPTVIGGAAPGCSRYGGRAAHPHR